MPWEGRSFEANPFADDDGSADENLLTQIQNFHAGEASSDQVVDAFRQARLLIPLLAAIGDYEIGAHGHAVDKSAELSIVTVEGPDGERVLPVFSSVAAMQAWNQTARPVPSDAIRVALAAASEETNRVVLDPGSQTEFVIRRPAIAAIAQSLPWTSPVANPLVRAAFETAVADISEILDFFLEDGDPAARLVGPELVLALKIQPGLDRAALDDVLTRLAQALAASAEVAESVDSLRVRVLPHNNS